MFVTTAAFSINWLVYLFETKCDSAIFLPEDCQLFPYKVISQVLHPSRLPITTSLPYLNCCSTRSRVLFHDPVDTCAWVSKMGWWKQNCGAGPRLLNSGRLCKFENEVLMLYPKDDRRKNGKNADKKETSFLKSYKRPFSHLILSLLHQNSKTEVSG